MNIIHKTNEAHPQIRLYESAKPENLVQCIKETFESISDQTKDNESGSTVFLSAVIVDESDRVGFVIGNLGNSGCALLIEEKGGSFISIALTEDHKPDKPRIKKRNRGSV